ncbi:MAG: hypothetical protein GTO14_02890 [Anaerolineales bacterium]|nr:hypothetical protein [Anaerolineales bacterium]
MTQPIHQIGKRTLATTLVGVGLLAISLSACATALGMNVPLSGFPHLSGEDLGAAVNIPDRPTALSPTKTPTALMPPTATATAVASPEPVRLTEGGCCSYPMWSPDSQWVLFLDKPGRLQPAGLYGVPVDGGERTLIHDQVGVYSESRSLVAYPQSGWMFVERWADGTKWFIPSEGRMVRFSPSGQYVTWEVSSPSIKFPDLRQRAIWVANADGTNAREAVTVNGGQFVGWEAGEETLIVTGRLGPSMPSGVWRIRVEDGAGRLLMEVQRPRSPLISPEGGWVAFFVAFDTDPDRNGLWVLQTDGMSVRKLDLFGAYRWRSEDVLLVIPLNLQAQGASLWQIDVATGAAIRLTDPKHTPLPIANNDWRPSPDGRRIVFLSSEDRNLWALHLPNP